MDGGGRALRLPSGDSLAPTDDGNSILSDASPTTGGLGAGPADGGGPVGAGSGAGSGGPPSSHGDAASAVYPQYAGGGVNAYGVQQEQRAMGQGEERTLRKSEDLRDRDQIPLLPEKAFLHSLGGPSIYTAGGQKWVQRLEEHRLQLAKQYVLDAMAGRELQILAVSDVQRIAQAITTSKVYKAALVLIVATNMFDGFSESPTRYCHAATWEQTLDVLTLTFYLVDLVLSALAVSPKQYLKRYYNWVYIFLIGGLAYDIIACHTYFVWGRAVVAWCKSRDLRRTVHSMQASVPRVFDILLLFATLLTFYALLGIIIYHGKYHDLDIEFTGAFDSFSRASLSMFVLATTENFPQIMYPALDRGYSTTAVFFFVSFLMIELFIVLSFLLAALYHTWKERHAKMLLLHRVRAYHALIAAYHVLLDDGKRKLDLNKWKDLVNEVRPHVREYEARWMFAFLDKDNDGEITLKEFMLGAVDALHFDFSDLRREDAERTAATQLWVTPERREILKNLVRHRVFVRGVYIVLLAHTLLLIYGDYPIKRGFGTAVSVLLVVFVVEQLLKFLAFPLFRFWRPVKFFDLGCIILGVICEWILPLTGYYAPGVEQFARVLRVLRLLTLSRRLRRTFSIFASVARVVILFFLVFVLFIYSYAGIGVLIFRNNLPNGYDSNPSTGDDDDYNAGDADILDQKVLMDNLPNTMLLLFQIATTNNWQDIMYPNVLDGAAPLVSSIYFVLFFILMVWFGTNITTALIIDAFVIVKQARDERAIQRWQQNKDSPGPEDRSATASSAKAGDGRDANATSSRGTIDSERDSFLFRLPKPMKRRETTGDSGVGVGGVRFRRGGGDMYRHSRGDSGIHQFILQQREQAAAHGSACERCDNCAVFVAMLGSPDRCHCGHGAVYHHIVNKRQVSGASRGGVRRPGPPGQAPAQHDDQSHGNARRLRRSRSWNAGMNDNGTGNGDPQDENASTFLGRFRLRMGRAGGRRNRRGGNQDSLLDNDYAGDGCHGDGQDNGGARQANGYVGGHDDDVAAGDEQALHEVFQEHREKRRREITPYNAGTDSTDLLTPDVLYYLGKEVRKTRRLLASETTEFQIHSDYQRARNNPHELSGEAKQSPLSQRPLYNTADPDQHQHQHHQQEPQYAGHHHFNAQQQQQQQPSPYPNTTGPYANAPRRSKQSDAASVAQQSVHSSSSGRRMTTQEAWAAHKQQSMPNLNRSPTMAGGPPAMHGRQYMQQPQPQPQTQQQQYSNYDPYATGGYDAPDGHRKPTLRDRMSGMLRRQQSER